MAFVLKKVSSYKWPVTVEIPVDGGKFKKETFTAIFKKMSRSAFNDLVDQGDDALVGEIIEGWDGIKDEDGDEVPFNDVNLQQLLDDPYVLRGIVSSYTESLTGGPAKN